MDYKRIFVVEQQGQLQGIKLAHQQNLEKWLAGRKLIDSDRDEVSDFTLLQQDAKYTFATLSSPSSGMTYQTYLKSKCSLPDDSTWTGSTLPTSEDGHRLSGSMETSCSTGCQTSSTKSAIVYAPEFIQQNQLFFTENLQPFLDTTLHLQTYENPDDPLGRCRRSCDNPNCKTTCNCGNNGIILAQDEEKDIQPVILQQTENIHRIAETSNASGIISGMSIVGCDQSSVCTCSPCKEFFEADILLSIPSAVNNNDGRIVLLVEELKLPKYFSAARAVIDNEQKWKDHLERVHNAFRENPLRVKCCAFSQLMQQMVVFGCDYAILSFGSSSLFFQVQWRQQESTGLPGLECIVVPEGVMASEAKYAFMKLAIQSRTTSQVSENIRKAREYYKTKHNDWKQPQQPPPPPPSENKPPQPSRPSGEKPTQPPSRNKRKMRSGSGKNQSNEPISKQESVNSAIWNCLLHPDQFLRPKYSVCKGYGFGGVTQLFGKEAFVKFMAHPDIIADIGTAHHEQATLAYDEICNEIQYYEELSQEGLAYIVPLLYGGNIGAYKVLVTEYKGESLRHNPPSKDTLEELDKCIDDFRMRGYEHGDMALRNVVQDSTGQLYMIDLGCAYDVNPSKAIC